MRDLSVIIPARNEEFLQNTIDDILKNIRIDTEIIVILDGYWPTKGIPTNSRVNVIHHSESIGQRAATNEGARLSDAKFIMKCDAHCAFDEGFDEKLATDCEYDWTVTPTMYNLHVFDWKCLSCDKRSYQGPKPKSCQCGGTEFERVMVWKPKMNPKSEYYYFDKDLRFQYWREYKKRPEAIGDIVPVMGSLGACMFMHRKRFFDLGGMDEDHGSWGQFGTEISCKAWLSGGKQMTNKKTWFSHMFRTQSGFGFPYKISGKQVSGARKRSKDLWLGGKWSLAKHDIQWLIDKFSPVPTWDAVPEVGKEVKLDKKLTKGLLYYTDNRCEERILQAARNQILRSCNGHKIVSVSQYPIDFGENYVLAIERSALSMFRQILKGLSEIDTDIVFFVEHDVIYHPSHFDFTPERDDTFYYNDNIWTMDASDGKALHYKEMKQVSGLVAHRSLLLDHYKLRVDVVERDGFTRKMGYEPGKPIRHGGLDDYGYAYYTSEHPNVDIKHGNNITRGRFKLEEYKCREKIKDSWILSNEIPYWGITGGRVDDFLRSVIGGTIDQAENISS